MLIRATTECDVEAVDAIYAYAKKAFREAGIPQWQGSYPDADTVHSDVAAGIGYVLCDDDGRVVGAAALTTTMEEAYNFIFDGSWLTPLEGPYVTVHRISVGEDSRGQGWSKRILAFAEELARKKGFASVRVDTHEQNAVMRGLLTSSGYVQCGTIVLLEGDEKGDPRLCYEKLV